MENLCMCEKNETLIYCRLPDFYKNFYIEDINLNLFKFKELDINYNEIKLENKEEKKKSIKKSNKYKIKKYCKKRNWKYEWLKFDNETIILIIINKQNIIHEFFGTENDKDKDKDKDKDNSQEEAAKKALKYFTSIDKKYYFKRKRLVPLKKGFLSSKDL